MRDDRLDVAADVLATGLGQSPMIAPPVEKPQGRMLETNRPIKDRVASRVPRLLVEHYRSEERP